MNVIGGAPDLDRFDFVLSSDASHESPNACVHWGIDPRFAVLCGEDDVVVQRREGVRHAHENARGRKEIQSRLRMESTRVQSSLRDSMCLHL